MSMPPFVDGTTPVMRHRQPGEANTYERGPLVVSAVWSMRSILWMCPAITDRQFFLA